MIASASAIVVAIGFSTIEVLARLEDPEAGLAMHRDRRQVDDGVQLSAVQHRPQARESVRNAERRGDGLGQVGDDVGDGDDLGLVPDRVQIGEHTPTPGGDHARAEDTDSQWGHAGPFDGVQVRPASTDS